MLGLYFAKRKKRERCVYVQKKKDEKMILRCKKEELFVRGRKNKRS